MNVLCMGCMEAKTKEESVCPHCGFVQGTPAKEPYQLQPGTKLKRYIVGKILGYGGFGNTYIAYDTQMKIKVAIKEFMPVELSSRVGGETKVTVFSGEKTEQFNNGKSKFLEEARKLAKFSTVNEIVSVLDAFEENGTNYFVMEYLEGITLKEHLQNKKILSINEAISIITPILNGLSVVHTENIMHRDIAPDNIFLCNDGRIKLIDFGSARVIETHRSRSLTVLYKEGYTPEEQYRSDGNQGTWTDVYACAACVYKMITGNIPPISIERTAKDELIKPSKLGVKISKSEENALMNALNIYANDRTQTAEEFKNQLLSEGVKRKKNSHKALDIGNWSLKQKIGLGSVGALLAGFIIFVGISLSTTGRPLGMLNLGNQLHIPDVVGLNLSDAKLKIENAGLTFNSDTGIIYNSNVNADIILNQSPSSATVSEIGNTVFVYVCSGAKPLTMPSLYGYNKDEAEQVLRNMGITNIIFEGEGTIIYDQSVLTNDTIQSDDTITLTLIKEDDDVTIVKHLKIPELIGVNWEQSDQSLYAYSGFDYKYTYLKEDDPKNTSVSGVVVGMLYQGRRYEAGESIDITDDSNPILVLELTVGKKSKESATENIQTETNVFVTESTQNIEVTVVTNHREEVQHNTTATTTKPSVSTKTTTQNTTTSQTTAKTTVATTTATTVATTSLREYYADKIGSTITFGGYSWDVIQVQNNTCELMMHDAWKAVAFDSGSAQFSTSSLCNELNQTLYLSIPEADRNRIIPTTSAPNRNEYYPDGYLDDTTTSYVYIMNTNELRDKILSDSQRICYFNGRKVNYWVNTAGESSEYQVVVMEFGNLNMEGVVKNDNSIYVRPCITINLD